MIKLYNGDCIQVMDELIEQGIKVDLILTDPPYGLDFKKNAFFDDSEYNVLSNGVNWLNKSHELLADGGHCYIFTATKTLGMWLNIFDKSDFNFKNIIHLKSHENGCYTKNNFSFRTEYVIFATKGKARCLEKVNFQRTSESWLNDKRNKNKKEYTYNYSNNFDLFVNNKKSKHHPNEKKTETLEIFIKLSTNEGDTVLDFTMGSGSAGVACKNTNRNFIGIELDEGYFKIAKERLNNER